MTGQGATAAHPITGSDGRTLILLAGVGGQGVLTAAEILGDAVHTAGLPVVVGQLHGMSQRGGSVEAQVIIGPGASSAVAGRPVDVLVAFDALEALRAVPRVRPGTVAAMAQGVIVPQSLTRGGLATPPADDVIAALRKAGARVAALDATAFATQAGARRTLNVVMLGALAGLDVLPIPADALWEAAARRCPPRYLEANRTAFGLGRTATSTPELNRETTNTGVAVDA